MHENIYERQRFVNLLKVNAEQLPITNELNNN